MSLRDGFWNIFTLISTDKEEEVRKPKILEK